jgi:hypothetical protein
MPLSEEEKETEAITVHLAEEQQKTGYALRSKTIIASGSKVIGRREASFS